MLVRRLLASTPLPAHARCFLVGLGKAAEGMTRGAAQALQDYETALVVTKQNISTPPARFTVIEAGHPVPDERSIAAGEAVLKFVSRLEPQDLLICLISGGGSALATAPVDGVSLADVQTVTSAALSSGADIGEINNLRRCLDRLKDGGLVAATRAQVLALILSDVIGDRLESIASGPTVGGLVDTRRAIRLLEKISIDPPNSLRRSLEAVAPRSGHSPGARIRNVIVGNARTAAEGALQQARLEGVAAEILDGAFSGEAQTVGQEFGRRLATLSRTRHHPVCLIATGECTVTISGPHGSGGRNQELALAAVEQLGAVENCMLITMATDGEDGPTDAAGAVVTGATVAQAREMGMVPREFLQRHDSHTFFGAIGDLLKPGYTGTNVNDIVLMLAL